jgi:regulation of enolase protein 1 (concanavalin A-like superfamily)
MRTLLSALPMPLSWQVPPQHCRSDEAASLTVRAPASSDMFIDPAGGEPTLNAPRVLGAPPEGDFRLSARVQVGFTDTFDAGVLLVWVDEHTWAKLCFERSPSMGGAAPGRPMAVSVVTRGTSDDANGFTVDGDRLWLRVSRLGPAWAFHASTDGAYWRLVRYFTLGTDAPCLVGFEAQSPTGQGCEVTFDQIAFVPERLADPRNGQ